MPLQRGTNRLIPSRGPYPAWGHTGVIARCRRIFLVSALVCSGVLCRAQSIATWTGGDGKWSSASKWSPSAVPTASTDVFFDSLRDGTGGTISLNPGGGIREARSLTFSTGTGSYVFDSNGSAQPKILYLGAGGITNNSTATQTFAAQVNLTASQTWEATPGSIMVENIVDLGANTLTFAGSGDFFISGEITGSGNVTKSGSGALFVNVTPSFTGSTLLESGTLQYDAPLPEGGALILTGGNLVANNQELSFSSLRLLSGIASITLGTDGISQTLSFDSVTYDSGTLTIYNWSADSTGDQIAAGARPSQEFLNHLTFDGYQPGAEWLNGVITPIPEPSPIALTIAGGLVLIICTRRSKGRNKDPGRSPLA